MKRILLVGLLLFFTFSLTAQKNDNALAYRLVTQHSEAIGITKDQLAEMRISSTYFNETGGTQMVYLLQGYKSLPVYNQMLVLAFKNEKLIYQSGNFIAGIETNTASQAPALTAPIAAKAAFRSVNVALEDMLSVTQVGQNSRLYLGTPKSVNEEVTAELMWVPTGKQDKPILKLAWQIQVVPRDKPDWWMVQVDASNGNIIDRFNLNVHDRLDNRKHNAIPELLARPAAIPTAGNAINPAVKEGTPAGNPLLVGSANYLVIPHPAESPLHPGGTAAVRSNPWTSFPGNATSLGWHNDGSVDYTISRGNNVWATEDRAGTNTNNAIITPTGLPATSTTSPDPLTFNFPPDYTVDVTTTSTAAAAFRQFAITNLFYWNNLMHDMTYQYGFNEVAGNFQANNQGRGGAGNDYVIALAQSAAEGSIGGNANFATPVDGGRGRMRMYLFPAVPKTNVHVNAPNGIAGDYTAVESVYSSANKLATLGPVTAPVAFFDDATGTAHEACGGTNTSLSGKIALIYRGNCNFTQKAAAAQAAGAVGIIMINNVPDALIAMGGGPDNTLTVPAVMISNVDGALLAAQVANGLNATLSGTAGVPLDGDLDAGVMCHEYGHGVSTRLTGGPGNSSCLGQSAQNCANIRENGSEGWSDYFGLMMTTNWATAQMTDGELSRGVGTYVIGQPSTGSGLRIRPYSTNLTVDPATYANMGDATYCSEIHNIGEIWCSAIWDMTWNIIQQENSINPSIFNAAGAGGNVIAMKLVVEAMKLQPCTPGFIDQRNAILAADANLYNSKHYCAIWNAFARRGMGFSAKQGSSLSCSDQTPAFDLPPAATITAQPANVTACAGDNATFTITATGDNLKYKWQVSTNNGGSWSDVSPAATTATLTVTGITSGMNNNQYRAVVTGGCAAAVNSSVATLTLNSTAPVITGEPANANVCAGTNATFTVTATGTNLTYKWQVSTNGGANWADVAPAATTATLTLTAVTTSMNNNQYRCVVTGGCSGSAFINSNAATLTIAAGTITINSQPANNTVCAGANATFTVAATGPGLSYNWQVSTDNGANWVNTNPAVNTPTLTLTGVTASLNNNLYRCVITGSGGCSTGGVTSSSAKLIVNTITAINTQPGNQAICAGGNASFCVTAVGTNLQYQWQVSATGCTSPVWTNVGGATSSCLSINNVTLAQNGLAYKCIVTGDCGSPVETSCATLSVASAAVITTQPSGTTVCPAATATFTGAASGFGVTYQWQVSTNNGGTWTDIAAATTTTLTLNNVTASMNTNQYRLVAFACGPVGTNSNAAILTVNNPVAITTQPSNAAACAGNDVSFSVNATGVGAISYQWQVSTNAGAAWTNITGATAATLNLNAVTAGMNNNQYRVVLNGTCTANLNSNAATLSINTPVVLTSQPANASACQGNSATFAVTATGTSITYQWQVSVNGGAFVNISNGGQYAGTTTNTLSISAVSLLMNNYEYRVIASGVPCGAVTSATAKLTANPTPTVVLTAASYTNYNPGISTGLFATTSPAGNYSYQWFKNNVATSATTASVPLTGDDYGEYYVIATNTNGCSFTSNKVSVADSASDILFIYPNPSNGKFQVRYYNRGGSSVARKLVVYDSKGAKVFMKEYSVTGAYGRMDVDLHKPGAGVYFVELTDANNKRIATERVNIINQ